MTRPPREIIDAEWKAIKDRTTKINRALFMARQMNEKNRTFYDESILLNEDGQPDYEISSMITIRKIPEDRITVNKPISINFTLDGNMLTKNITFLNQNITERTEVRETHQETEIEKEEEVEESEVEESTQNRNKKLSKIYR